jgi:hypothetical protein
VNVAIVRNGVVVNVSDRLMRFSPLKRLNNENGIAKGSSVIVTNNTVCSIVDRRLRTHQQIYIRLVNFWALFSTFLLVSKFTRPYKSKSTQVSREKNENVSQFMFS